MEPKPIRITLTTFVKFALATTSGKRVAAVEEAKEYYEPVTTLCTTTGAHSETRW